MPLTFLTDHLNVSDDRSVRMEIMQKQNFVAESLIGSAVNTKHNKSKCAYVKISTDKVTKQQVKRSYKVSPTIQKIISLFNYLKGLWSSENSSVPSKLAINGDTHFQRVSN